MNRVNQLKWVVGSILIIFAIVMILPKEAVKASTKTMTAGVFDTISVFDKTSASVKNVTWTSSNKGVNMKKKTYLSAGKKHTVILAFVTNNTGEAQTSKITIKYYDINKKKTYTIKTSIKFIKDYNRGYSKDQTMKQGAKKNFEIKNSAQIKAIHSVFGTYDSSKFMIGSYGEDAQGICTVKTSTKDKKFNVTANKYGRADSIIIVDFMNGEQYWYQFQVSIPEGDGSIYTENKKIVKGQSIILYYAPQAVGKITVKSADETVVSAKLTQNKEVAEEALVLTGLKTGKTKVSVTYDDNGKSIVNKYEINVLDNSPLSKAILLSPTEVDLMYTCSYPMTDSSGNELRMTEGAFRHIEITPNSSEVRVDYYGQDQITLKITAAGLYNVDVKLKNLDGSVVQSFTLAITAGALQYSDYEKIIFAQEEEAKDFFCGTSNKTWINRTHEYLITFSQDDVVRAIEASNPWFIRYGDYAPGEATYSIDINRQVIVVDDFEQTVEIGYEIISKDHIRLTINGQTLDYFAKE